MTDDLPTPPLPLTIAYTLVSEDGWANGITRSGAPPRTVDCRSLRWSSLITSSSTRTPVTPASGVTAPVTRLVMVSRIGQPGHGQVDADGDEPVAADLDGLDHAELGDRAADLGVVDAGQRGQHLLAGGKRGAHALHATCRRDPGMKVPGRATRSTGPPGRERYC